MTLSPTQIEAATRAFLRQMRLEHINRYPDRDHVRVPDYDALELPDRSILTRSMKKALESVPAQQETGA